MLRFAKGGGRTLSGTAIRYGDVARLPWGQERFEPGAFDDVAGADVILNVAHDRGRPIARTGGGGLVLADSADALTIRADLPATREADDALASREGQNFARVEHRISGDCRAHGGQRPHH